MEEIILCTLMKKQILAHSCNSLNELRAVSGLVHMTQPTISLSHSHSSPCALAFLAMPELQGILHRRNGQFRDSKETTDLNPYWGTDPRLELNLVSSLQSLDCQFEQKSILKIAKRASEGDAGMREGMFHSPVHAHSSLKIVVRGLQKLVASTSSSVCSSDLQDIQII